MLSACLQDFRAIVGLQVNWLKSSIYLSGIDVTTRRRLLSIMDFQEGSMPFRYLWIPLAAERLQISDYNPLLDSLSQRKNTWPKQTLFYADKAELITLMLQGVSVSSYLSYCYHKILLIAFTTSVGLSCGCLSILQCLRQICVDVKMIVVWASGSYGLET